MTNKIRCGFSAFELLRMAAKIDDCTAMQNGDIFIYLDESLPDNEIKAIGEKAAMFAYELQQLLNHGVN